MRRPRLTRFRLMAVVLTTVAVALAAGSMLISRANPPHASSGTPHQQIVAECSASSSVGAVEPVVMSISGDGFTMVYRSAMGMGECSGVVASAGPDVQSAGVSVSVERCPSGRLLAQCVGQGPTGARATSSWLLAVSPSIARIRATSSSGPLRVTRVVHGLAIVFTPRSVSGAEVTGFTKSGRVVSSIPLSPP